MTTANLPIEDAPKDGTEILGIYDDYIQNIRWAETRQCMLAGVGGGNGYFSAGWEDTENWLIADEPEFFQHIKKSSNLNKSE